MSMRTHIAHVCFTMAVESGAWPLYLHLPLYLPPCVFCRPVLVQSVLTVAWRAKFTAAAELPLEFEQRCLAAQLPPLYSASCCTTLSSGPIAIAFLHRRLPL